jgi:hypothetical protein
MCSCFFIGSITTAFGILMLATLIGRVRTFVTFYKEMR